VEIRALADSVKDAKAKERLEAAANNYDKLALRAQARQRPENSKLTPPE
jgi:hypothetical protein